MLIGWIVIFTGCNSNVFYDQNNTIENHIWNQHKTEEFEVEIHDTLAAFDFFLNLRHTTDYKYSNVYFFVDTEFPDGTTSTDTMECMLANRQGKWFGKGMGKIKDNRILVRRNIRFPHAGKYIFRFAQAMREPNLVGITDIGIRLEKNKQ